MQISRIFKLINNSVAIVSTFAAFLIIILMGTANSQHFMSVEFNDTMSRTIRVQVPSNNRAIPTIRATIRYTGSTVSSGFNSYVNGSRHSGYVDKRNSGGYYQTDFGNWYIDVANNPACGTRPDGMTYYCGTARFEPNSTAINALSLGSEVRANYYYQPKNQPSAYGESNIYFVREDIDLSWRDFTGKVKDNTSSPDQFRLHRIILNTYYNNTSELDFELWIKDGHKEISKFRLNKSDFVLVTNSNNQVYSVFWDGDEWYYESTYGTWVVGEQNYCSSEPDNKKCLTAVYSPNDSADNVLGRNISMELRVTKTLGNSSETKSIEFKVIGDPLSSPEWMTENSGTITTGNQLEFNDMFGTASVFKKNVSSLSIDATEKLDQTSQSFDESAGVTEMLSDYQVYPLGNNLFKYGHWLVEENFSGVEDPHDELFETGTLRFAFRPNTAAINNPLNTDESITSTLSFKIREGNSQSQIIQTNTITVTINRSSVKPILSISSKTSSVVEGQSVAFVITSNVDPMQPYYVSYIPTNSKGDFLNSTTNPSGYPQFENLTFSQAEGSDAWTDEIEIDLRESDGVDTEDGSIKVTLNTATEYAFYFAAAEPDNSATIRVEDSEKPTLSFVENEYSFTEEDADKNVELTLNLSESVDDAVMVSYSIVEETAIGGTDFVDIANGSVSFPPNTTSTPINIQIKGDELSEDDETFRIIISAPPSNAYFRHGVSTLESEVTIFDDEPIIMNVATTDFKIAEDVINGNFIVEVELTKTALIANPNTPIPEPVSFLVETSSGTATIDTDFKTPDQPPTQTRFRIPADAKTFSFAFPILNDVKNEGNETFNVRIHDLQQAAFADGTTEQTLELTIIDNEKPTLSFMRKSKDVDEEDADTNVELTLNLSGPIEEAVDISYELISESANEDADFIDNGNGVVSIAANTTSIPISIQIKGDDINEGNETFKVRVTTLPSNAVFAEGVSMLEATVTITDDESPTLSVDNSTLTISERAEMTHIVLKLSGPTNEDVVVTYSTSITGSDIAQQADFTAQTESTYTFPTSSIPPTPSTFGLIQIPIINDTDEEENETFTLTLTEISGAVFADEQSSIVLQVTIIDDEGLPILSIDSTEITVNEQSGYTEIGLSFAPASAEPVTIIYSTIKGTADGGSDFTKSTNATFEIPSGSKDTIFIPIINDNIFEGEEKFSVEISAIQGAAYGSGVINTPIMITITDDETEPTLTISAYSCEYSEPLPTNFSVNESAGNLIFNAKLSHPSKNPVTFNYSATADTATGADFYVSSTTQYTIQPGSICTEIVTPITHDILFEEDEQFNIAFTTDTGTNIIPAFKVKIEDDDVAIWSIEDLAMNEGDSDTEMAFRVNLSTPVYQTVRVKWTASTIAGNTATFGEDYAPNHNSYTDYVTVLAGRIEGTIKGFEITGDTIFEPNETFTITLSDPAEGTQIGDGVAIGTIINDDPEPTLSISTINQLSGN